MGDKVKAVAGGLLVIASGGLAGAGIFGTSFGLGLTGTSALLASGAISLVGASMVGSALTPEAPDMTSTDAYAGTKLQNTKNNTSPVAIAYGHNRLGGNVIWQGTRGTDNNDLHQIIAVSQGAVGIMGNYYANNELMSVVGTNGVYKTTDGYVQVLGYITTPSTLYFPSDDSGNIATASSLFPSDNLDTDIPDDLCLLMVRQVFNNPNHTSPDTMTATIQGQLVKIITDADTISTYKTYSNNPSEIVLDLLLNGLNISESDIDTASFYNTKTKCNTYGYTCNIVINQQSNIQSIISDVLSTCRGSIVYSQGLWKMKLDEKEQTVYKALTHDDIINNSMNISMKGFQDIANEVEVSYINPNDEWLSAVTIFNDQDLIDNDGQTLTKTLNIKGVTSTTQANKLAEITLNTMRYSEDESGNRVKQTPLSCVFATTVKNAELEVGDIISLDHDLLDRVRKFVILSVETDQSGAIQVSAREYAETHFKDSSNNYII